MIFGLNAMGQSYEINDVNSLSDQFKFGRFTDITFDETSEQKNYEGSPFFNDNFFSGEVVINDSSNYRQVPLRYNIYTDKIQFSNNQGRILEFNLANQKYVFTIEGHQFVYKDYFSGKENEKGVLELLFEGQISLYKRYSVVFKSATKEAGFKPAEPNRFERLDDKYLIAIENNLPESINLSKKLLESLKVFKPDIEEYVKTHKIKLRSEQDLIQLIQYCNDF